ncbi:MAG: ATP-binding protein, partial [Dehalococcoidia bacterium]
HADWTTPHTPTPQEQALLEMAARLAGQAILKARTLEQEREARRWSEALAKVLQAGTRPGPLPHILQDILESMGNYWQAPGGIIRLLDRATNNLVAVACIGFDLADLPPQPVDGTGGGFSHLIFRERRVGAFGYEELVRAGSFVPRLGYRFMVGTPLEMQGQPIGVVHLDWKEERPFTQEDLQRFDLMVRTACQAVERAWLYEEAERRARALAEANQALNLQAAILNQVSEAVAATDTEGRLCYWGPGAERLTGVPSHQALGQPAYALLGGTEAMWAECVHKVLEGGESTAIRTFQAALPNGKCAWLEVVLSPWYEEGGHLKGFILVARDITNIRQMEVQLLQLEKMRALGQMAAGVAHDFNNFLAVIMGQAELSLMDQALLPRHRRALEAIRRASADGAQVVRRLATLARMRAEGQAEPVDVCKVCHEALDSTRFAWEERAARQGITITTSLDLQDVPPASCTESELREVLINLILNGIDAMPKGGVLTISCFQEEERVCIAVKDTGTGIPPEVRTHLFEPFFTTKGARGTGLGLAVSYSIVKRYGGDIEVNTKVGEGSTFTVSLPIAQVPQEQGKHRGGRPTTTRSLHLLVVDDDPAVADLLRDLLASMGHRPEVFQDPAKALEAFTAQEWDGVITDLSMPDLTGWEVAAYIKKARPSVPVLLLTGYGDHIDLQEARARGVDGVLGKPISIEDLASAFLALVEGGGKAVPLVQEGKHPKIGRYYPFR